MRSTDQAGDPRLLAGFGVVLGLVGVGLLGAGLWTIGRAVASRWWPTVPGVVVSSGVEVHDGRNDVDEVPVTTYHPALRYAYEAGGRRYVGERITSGDFGSTDLEARRAVAERYPVAAAVTVHYDPDAPEDAVLEPGPVAFNLLMPCLGLVFLAGSVFIVRQARQLMKGSRTSGLR
jgi:hypothetical protein